MSLKIYTVNAYSYTMNRSICCPTKRGIHLLAVLLFVIGIVTISLATMNYPDDRTSGDIVTKIKGIPHSPIRINNNTDFDKLAGNEGWPGNGSSVNPYIIEGYDIDAADNGPGIYIGNTTVYFVIKNCSIHNSSVDISVYYQGAGIQLSNITNGTIDNCEIYDVTDGIWINYTVDTQITNSYIHNLGNDGIHILDGTYNVSISHNTIRGNGGTSGSGIYLTNGDNCNINNNTVINYAYGVYISAGADYNLLRDNKIYSSTVVGIRMRDCTHNDVLYNTINNTDGTGIYYQITTSSAQANIRISYNYIHDNSGKGVSLDTVNDAHIYITNNKIIHNGKTGIYTYQGISYLYIEYNTVDSNGYLGVNGDNYGIYVENTFDYTYIRYNRINNSYDGIHGYKWLATNGEISYNRITNISASGIYYNALSDFWRTLYTYNNYIFNADIGIYYSTYSKGNISNNNISNCPTGIKINNPTPDSVTVYSNTISNSSISGISVNADGAKIAHNTISNANQTGIWLSPNSNRNEVMYNEIYNTNITGIYLNGADENTIHNNTINNSGVNGISLWGASNNTFYGNYIGNSTSYGIYVNDTSGGNIFYQNFLYFNHGSNDTFNNSHVQAYDSNGTNLWNTTTYGNYWYDWANNNDTNDNDGNGIVDWPYPLDGNTDAKDYYPLKSTSAVPEFSLAIYLIFVVLLAISVLKKF